MVIDLVSQVLLLYVGLFAFIWVLLILDPCFYCDGGRSAQQRKGGGFLSVYFFFRKVPLRNGTDESFFCLRLRTYLLAYSSRCAAIPRGGAGLQKRVLVVLWR